MIKTIEFPQAKKHWICHNEDGSVMQFGETSPTQVTITNQPVLEGFDSEDELNTYIGQKDVNLFPPIPLQGKECKYLKVYKYGANKAKCLQGHTRTHRTPEEEPALWTVIKTVSSYDDVEVWNGSNYLAYQTVGYLVKYNNKIWASKEPISHTWIAPALTGDGAISWEFVADV